MKRDDWDFGQFFFPGFGVKFWTSCGSDHERRQGGGRRRRQQIFESGEIKFVILKLLKEKPRHGYEIIKALEEKLSGWYTPSAGTVYPTLQLLEDQGYVRIVETEGKKVYHITEEGERFLEENRSVIEDIFDRVKEVVGNFAGGSMSDLNQAFARLARMTYRNAGRYGGNDPRTQKIIKILREAADQIEREME
ncbi:MAG: PadR family transcriptional regulator [Blastocatellia bacterium]|nr:PadR family transcriptional regulator [Blastocatellia bacterium]